jgi:pimeloyl-ACP methyl ester carboxylesterase
MSRILKRVLITVAVLGVALATMAAVKLGPYWYRVEAVAANPTAGFHADYFLYLSPGARERASRGESVTFLIQPNNSGTTSDDPAVHRKDAWWTGFGRHGLADQLEVALLVPAFVRPSEDWRIYTHALDRDVLTTDRRDLARLDLQLLAMIDDAILRLGAQDISSNRRVLIQGYSASGMFANRFAALHPDRVKAVAAGSPGGWPIAPVDSVDSEALPYPGGIADLEELTGRPFDAMTWRGVPQLLVMGDQDDNDGLDFNDGWEKDASARIDRHFGDTPLRRWPHAERLYGQAGANARFLLVPGVGHDRRALQKHTTEFFRKVLARMEGRG